MGQAVPAGRVSSGGPAGADYAELAVPGGPQRAGLIGGEPQEEEPEAGVQGEEEHARRRIVAGLKGSPLSSMDFRHPKRPSCLAGQ